MKLLYLFFGLSLFGPVVLGQELDVLINEALVNNPEVQAFEVKYQVAQEKTIQVNSLPNTEFGLGYFLSEPETRTGAQRFKVSAKQMLPAFGTITARENYSDALANVAYQDIVIAKRKLVVNVSQLYYNLYALHEKQRVIEQHIALLETYETLALNAVQVSKANAVDVLKLQIRQNELEQQKQLIAQDYLAERTAFNTLLNRDGNTKVEFGFQLVLPQIEEVLVLPEKLKVHPELIKFDQLYESVAQSELLNQKERNPMLGFGLDYIAVSERPNMMFNDNGKDIVMPMLSLSIPIFNKSFNSKTRQSALQQEDLLLEKESRLNSLLVLLDRALTKLKAAQISYNTQLKNLANAKDAEDILLKSYQTGIVDFNDILDLQELQFKFQINQVESVKSYFWQLVLIKYLTN